MEHFWVEGTAEGGLEKGVGTVPGRGNSLGEISSDWSSPLPPLVSGGSR